MTNHPNRKRDYSNKDFPAELTTVEQKLIWITQHANMGDGQLLSAGWGEKTRFSFLMKAREHYTKVAQLCESLAMQIKRTDSDI